MGKIATTISEYRLQYAAGMKRTPTLVAFAAAVTMSHAAFASTIILFNESRYVLANGTIHWNEAAGAWSDSVTATNDGGGRGSASQTSNISTSFIGGSGSSTADLLPGATERGGGATGLAASFTIFQPYTAQLDVDLFANGGGFARASLFDSERSTILWNAFVRDGTTVLAEEGMLLPGTYQLTLLSQSNLFGTPTAASSFDGALLLTPIAGAEIPEPASLTLLGLGLLGVAARRRMRS